MTTQVMKANELGSKIVPASLVPDHNTETEKRTVGTNVQLGVQKPQTTHNVTSKCPDAETTQIK